MLTALWLGSSAWAKTGMQTAHVCPTNVKAAVCTFDDLAAAIDDEDYDVYILEAGTHAASVELSRPVTVQALPNAILTWESSQPIFLIDSNAAGSRFENLVVEGSPTHGNAVAFSVAGATVDFVNLEIRALAPSDSAVLWFSSSATVTIDGLLLDNQPFSLYPVFLQSADLTLRNATFRDLTGTMLSVIHGQNSDLWIENSTFTAGPGPSAFLWGVQTDIEVDATGFYPGTRDGTPIYLQGGSLTWAGGEMGPSTEVDTAIEATDADVHLTDVSLFLAGGTSGVYCTTCPTLVLDGTTVQEVSPNPDLFPTPLVKSYDSETVDVFDSWFCGATAGGALEVWGEGTSVAYVDRSVFQGNNSDDAAGGIAVLNADLVLSNSTFFGNSTEVFLGGAALQADSTSSIDVQKTLFVSNVGGAATVYTLLGDVQAFETNAFDLGTLLPTSFLMPASNQIVDVVFEATHPDVRCGVSIAIDAKRTDLFVVEQAIGAGAFCYDAEIPEDGIDQDCDGFEQCGIDADGDSFAGDGYGPVPIAVARVACPPPGTDCNDADAGTHPGAPEVWYDGVDADCQGDDDFDADGDGYPTPDDCDDGDPNTFPGAPDRPYDNVDADCAQDDDFDVDGDGVDVTEDCNDEDPTLGRCRVLGSGCDTGGPTHGALLGLIALAAARSRLRRTSAVAG